MELEGWLTLHDLLLFLIMNHQLHASPSARLAVLRTIKEGHLIPLNALMNYKLFPKQFKDQL